MTKLQILLLGPPDVRWGDEPITILRRIPRALLFYLASRAAPVGRAELSALFWNETSDANARRRLQENLSRLRGELPEPDLVITNADIVRLDSERVVVDQSTFEELIKQAGQTPWQIPENEPLPEHTYRKLESANNLWRGAHFCAGSYFPSTINLDNWLTQTSSRLDHLRVTTLERLAGHAYSISNLEKALEFTQAVLETDNFNEKLHYQVMKYFIELGNINAAQKHFDHIVKLFRRELNLDPSPKIIALSKYITQESQAAKLTAPLRWEIHQAMKVPFVGRQEIIVDARRSLKQNKGVFILGEAGSGKTRLVQRISEDLGSTTRILVSNCRPEEATLPFQPIRETLRRYMAPNEWVTLPEFWASHLIRIYPEIAELRPELKQPDLPSDPDQARGLLLEAIRHAFLALSVESHLFFVLDDIHWADEATLATIAYLLPRSPFNNNASLSATARQESISQHLEDYLTAIQTSKDGVVISIPNLTPEDITDLARAVLHTIPPSVFIKRIDHASGGNPLFILEILRAIIAASPEPDLTASAPLPLTENLRKLISTRIKKLSLPTRRILETASIIGPSFDPHFLSHIADAGEPEIIKALEEGEHSNFIKASPGLSGVVQYTFIHDKIREVLQDELNSARAQLLHRRVAQAIESKPEDVHANILAFHYEAGGDLLRAYRLWAKAGRQARELIATTEAYQAYQRASELLDQVEDKVLDEEIYNLYAQWAEMAYNFNETQILNNLGNELRGLGESRNSPALIGTAYDILSDACFTVNDFEGGLENASQAIAYLENSNYLAKHIQAYNHQGVFLYMLGRLSEATESFQDALALSTESKSREVIGYRSHAHYQMSLIRTFEGFPKQGRDHALLAIKDGENSDPYMALFPGYSISALAHYYLGNYGQSLDHAHLGIELGRKTQAVRLLGYTHSYAAMSALGLGDIGTAMDHAEQAIEIGKKYQHDDVAALGLCQLGDIYRILLDYPLAAETYQRGMELGAGHFIGLDNTFHLGLTLHTLGQTQEGYQLMNGALNAFESIGIKMGAILTQSALAVAYTCAGEWDKARDLANHLNNEVINRSLKEHQALITMLLGQIALHDGETETALQHLRTAIEMAKNIQAATIELSSHHQLIGLVNEQEQDKLRQRVKEIIDQIGDSIKRPENHKRFQNLKEQAYLQAGINR